MLTFFTTAKPFQGHSAVIQRNALKSWTLLHPDVEVILFGDEEGTAEVCTELDLRHEPHVERHESGIPYMHHMFARAQEIARHNFLCYSNCDIMLLKDFRQAFEKTLAWSRRFLLVGRRWDTDVTEPIDFHRPHWARDLRQRALTTGFHQTPAWVDFFLFPKGLYDEVPPLVVGRPYWDHWTVWKALSAGAAVVDCSAFVVPVHQNHGYGHHPQGHKGVLTDALAMRNFELSGSGRHLRSMLDATHKLTRFGHIREIRGRRQLDNLQQQRLWRRVMNWTYPFRKRLGLRKQTFDRILGHLAKPVD
jgi:hypothetical protein